MDTTESDPGSGDTKEHWTIHEYTHHSGLVPFKMEWIRVDEEGLEWDDCWARELVANGFDVDPFSVSDAGPFFELLLHKQVGAGDIYGLVEVVWGQTRERIVVREMADWFDLNEYLRPFAANRTQQATVELLSRHLTNRNLYGGD